MKTVEDCLEEALAIVKAERRVEQPKKKVKKWLWANHEDVRWFVRSVMMTEAEAADYYPHCEYIKLPHTEIEVDCE